MKKYIPFLIAAAVVSGCAANIPEQAYANLSSASQNIRSSAKKASDKASKKEDTNVSSDTGNKSSGKKSDGKNDSKKKPSGKKNDDKNSSKKTSKESENTIKYPNGSPRFNDPDAIKDVEMSATREYVYTDDKGVNGSAPGEVTYFAKIPLCDDMPSRIELIDINTDEHIGYMYDNGKKKYGDEKKGDGIYSIKIKYDLDIDTDPDVSETWTRCYFALYKDSAGTAHTCMLPTFVNVMEQIRYYIPTDIICQ